MKESIQNTNKSKLSLFEKIIEGIGWIQIVLSPLLLSLLFTVPFYFSNETNTRLIISVLIVLAGLIIGIIWANKVAREKGTINFLSRISASPELDKEEENEI